ncbi:MAG TPA: gamma carbonic anhydrase family protein [Alphaproteobacteria bacterium]|nr:gamma carbonic anhydrase family protein [Alphaproteobacteria bacterium]
MDGRIATPPLILPYRNQVPRIAPSAFIAPGATVIGDVEIGEEANLWFGVIVRGDVHEIRIGSRTNVQDGTVIHGTRRKFAVRVGIEVTIGHMALIHACTLEDRSFVGMKACVMDGAYVESGAMVAAGAVVTPGKRVPKRQVWAGNPARYMRDVTDAELARIDELAQLYSELGAEYRTQVVGRALHPPVSAG